MEGAFLRHQTPAAAAAPRQQPHVLLFPLPTQGHINPFVALGQRLSASGILSTLLLIPYHFQSCLPPPEEEEKKKKKKKEHLCFAALDLPPEINTKLSSGTLSPEIFEILDTQLVAPLRTFILSSRLLTNAHDNAGIAITASEEEHHHEIFHFRPPISCLISDTFMPWTVDLAQEMGIPRVEMWTGSATAYAFTAAIPQLISKGLLPYKQGHLFLLLLLFCIFPLPLLILLNFF